MLLGGGRVIHACQKEILCPAAPALVLILCRVAGNTSSAPKFAGCFPESSSMRTDYIQPWFILLFEAVLLQFLGHRFLWAAVPHAQGFQSLLLLWLQVNVQAVRHRSGRSRRGAWKHALLVHLTMRSASATPFQFPEYSNFPSSAILRFCLLGLLVVLHV